MVADARSFKPIVAALTLAAAVSAGFFLPVAAQEGTAPPDAAGAPPAGTPAPEAADAGTAARAAGDPDRLDALFAELGEAEEGRAARIERQIIEEWSKSGSPAMDLLLRRGRDALQADDPAAALDHFSALVDHAPGFAEGYNGRATAHYLLGQFGPALEDIRQVLVLNPRHFGALQGFGIMLEEMGREAEALEVLRRVRALHPQAPHIGPAIERLQAALEGQTL